MKLGALMKGFACATLSTLALLSTGHYSKEPFGSAIERGLGELAERGFVFSALEAGKIEATSSASGQSHMFQIPHISTGWPSGYEGIPTLTIDLTTIDTSLYSWKYRYVNSFPLSGEWGFPLQVSDLDGDTMPEAYGVYQTQQSYETRVYELEDSSGWLMTYVYLPETGRVDKLSDIDENELSEVYTRFADTLFVFEQTSSDTIPTQPKFRFRQWYYDATGIPNQLADMTGDGRQELVYAGSEADTFYTSIRKTYVAEYDSALNTFRVLWSDRLPPDCIGFECTGALAVGDFDGDGSSEFVTSNFDGNVYVAEYVSGDSFAVVWTDSLSVAGRVTAGDVDGNGIEEFFVGGDKVEPDGYVHGRVFAYERTADNSYEPVFAFDIYPTGLFFVDLYQTVDMDGDGQKELLLSFAGGILIIKGIGEHAYEVFYYKPASYLDGVSGASIDSTGIPYLFISKHLGGQPIVKRTDMYLLDSTLVGVRAATENLPTDISLDQNYPNPFNPSTTIRYRLTEKSHVTLTVYDLLGREIETIVDKVVQPGLHERDWVPGSGKGGETIASGVFLYRLQVGSQSYVRKMLYLK